MSEAAATGEAGAAAPEAEHPGQSCPPQWPAPLRALTAVSRLLSVIEGVGIIFFLTATIFLATWQCVERNLVQHHLPFFRTPPWIDGVIRHSVFLLGFIGGAYATFSARHIRIDAITRVLSVKKRLAMRVLTTLIALGLVTLFTYASWGVYQLCLEEAGDAAQAEQLFTTARGAMVMVVGYGVIAFHFIVQIALDLGWLVSKTDPPASYISEASAH